MRLVIDFADYALVAALILSSALLFGPWIRQGFRRNSQMVASFGGGLALAYVFLNLLPELELAHHLLNDRVHLVTLFSFLVFYILEVRLLSAVANKSHAMSHGRVFWLHIGLSWLYTWLVIFALPNEVAEQLFFTIIGSLAIGLHLVYKDYVLREHHSEDYQSKGRYILALAPILGWLTHEMLEPNEYVSDLFIAVLAGFLMQNVFREELPKHTDVRIGWLVTGAGVFSLLVWLTP